MHNACPICGETAKERLGTLCANMAVLGPLFEPAPSYNALCPCCGCVYVETAAAQELFTAYYRDVAAPIDYESMFGARQTRDYYARILANIAPYMDPQSRILDCGCGTGGFLAHLKEMGYAHAEGIDPSPACVRAARQRGALCEEEDAFSQNPAYKGRFDMIVLSHVLEHIFDARGALENLKTMLAPGGHLYIEVPDAARYAEVDFTPYFFFTYEHLAHYGERTLKNLAAARGLRLASSGGFLKCEKYYVRYGVFREGASRSGIVRDERARRDIRAYREGCEARLRRFIEPLERSGEPLLLWGIGASTAQLLGGAFDRCDVRQLIDANPKRQGLVFPVAGHKIATQPPERAGEGTIVILPVMYKDAIEAQIRGMGLKNRIVSLAP
jgi:2-polyprenyl-3-methyl-5-hydroxy-6-metoxy-1,4-benzoquinol methylase